MNAVDEYGPDNPRGWDASHPSLTDPRAPHETSGLMRAHRSGKSGADLMVMFKLKGTKLIKLMQEAMDEESAASQAGRPIHDALIPKEKR